MTTKIWITRTQPAAMRSAENWLRAGFDPIIAPLLDVEPVTTHHPLAPDTDLIFTSAHAVRHLNVPGDGRRVYAIGKATAKVAKEHGFSNIIASDGNWRNLLDVIDKTQKKIVHVSGEVVQGRLVETLNERGLSAERRIVYRTHPVRNWPATISDIQAVALYSPLAAKTLMELPTRDLSGLTAYCLSENVAAPLGGMAIRIADSPSETALIACSHMSDP